MSCGTSMSAATCAQVVKSVARSFRRLHLRLEVRLSSRKLPVSIWIRIGRGRGGRPTEQGSNWMGLVLRILSNQPCRSKEKAITTPTFQII